MGLFKSWLREMEESAVPQTVDLTNGGKSGDTFTYWGAMPASGSDYAGTPPRRERKRKKKKKGPRMTGPAMGFYSLGHTVS